MSPLALAAIGHAVVAASFTVVCAIAAHAAHAARRRTAPPLQVSRVVLLRPVEELTAALEARFEHDASSTTRELVRVLCSPRAIASTMRSAASGIGELEPVNRKAAHLRAGLGVVATELDDATVVVHADSDVVLRPGDVDALVDALDGELSLAFAPPSPHGTTALRRALAQSVMALSPQAFASIAALSRITGSPPVIAGKLVAIRAPLLDALGGYECMMHTIGDDVALVEAALAKGARISMSPRAAITENDASTRALFDQLTRWFRVLAAHRPHLLLSYPILVAPLPITVVLCVLAASPTAWLALAGSCVARLVLAVVLARGAYRDRVSLRNVLLAPLSDLLVLASVARAVLGRSIRWAGRTYRVGRGGRILEVR